MACRCLRYMQFIGSKRETQVSSDRFEIAKRQKGGEFSLHLVRTSIVLSRLRGRAGGCLLLSPRTALGDRQARVPQGRIHQRTLSGETESSSDLHVQSAIDVAEWGRRGTEWNALGQTGLRREETGLRREATEMKKSRFTEDQIIGVLKEHQAEVPDGRSCAASTGSRTRPSTTGVTASAALERTPFCPDKRHSR